MLEVQTVDDLRLLQDGQRFLLAEGKRAAVGADLQAADKNIHLVRLKVGAGIAGCGNETAPICILAVGRRFAQGALCDGLANKPGVVRGRAVFNPDGEQLCGAFPVGRQHPAQLAGNGLERNGQRHQPGIAGIQLRVAGGAVRQEQHGIADGGIPIDGDVVIGGSDHLA